ncbi:GpE family phage tail protein [Leptospira sp. 96542]|nr:GpE family phage tail protein [Leptospira sp. 96542]
MPLGELVEWRERARVRSGAGEHDE